jgi:hypothetical protein
LDRQKEAKMLAKCDLALIAKKDRELLEMFYGIGRPAMDTAQVAVQTKRSRGAATQAILRAFNHAIRTTFEKGIE